MKTKEINKLLKLNKKNLLTKLNKKHKPTMYTLNFSKFKVSNRVINQKNYKHLML